MKGTANLARRLESLGRDLGRMDVTREGRQVARRAGQEAPRRTGRLSRSPEVLPSRKEGHATVSTGDVPYGPPVHSGVPSRGQAPNRYLHRAARREAAGVVRSIRRRVGELIRRHNLN